MSTVAASGGRFDPWVGLRGATQARIGLGRSGMSLPTAAVLELQACLAAARDSVHLPLDVDALVPGLRQIGLGEPIVTLSKAPDRETYLRRPDLGRMPASLTGLPHGDWDLGFLIADGLSSAAVARHAVPALRAIVDALDGELSLAPPVVVTQARVAVADGIGQAMGVRAMLVLIGERPGLSVADSLGVYLTFDPQPGRTDAERNCISNIHPPEGLSYQDAAQTAVALVRGAHKLGCSGVALKAASPTSGVLAAD